MLGKIVGLRSAARPLPPIVTVVALAWLSSASAAAQTTRETGRQDAAVPSGGGHSGDSAPTAGGPAAEDARSARPDTAGILTLEAAAKRAAPSAGALAGRPTVSAVRVQEAPGLDGRLDDLAWRTATRVTTFVQQRPVEGTPASEQTEVYIAYDNQKLYFGIYAHYSDPGLIRANRVDRDKTDNDDTVAVFFDPFLDQQTGYAISVNGYGVQGDSLLRSGPGGQPGSQPGGRPGGAGPSPGGSAGAAGGDKSWDALFQSAAQLVEDGWTAEIAIPFKSLRYPARRAGEMHRWGFQVQREIRSKDESVVWAPISRDVMGFLPQMGLLDGLSNLSTSRNLEILPTFTAVQVGSLDRSTGEFGTNDSEEGGLNLKYGITSNLTLDFAFNPDFSQIESDRQQIEVNLRFPIFFPELRPFFLEGQEIFRIIGPVQVVHTRTIVDPKYGAKLTGKIGKTTLGFVVANDEAPGRVADRRDPAFGQTAQVAIARVKHNLYSESHVGAIFTDREFLDSHSRVGGVDGQFKLGQNHRLAFSGVITADRDLAGVHKTGHEFDANFRKEGRHLSYLVAHFEVDPDIRTGVGFARRVDQKNTVSFVSYRWWPESWMINWGPRVNYDRNYDFRGTLVDQMTGVTLSGDFAKNINLSANVNRDFERYREVDFRKTRVNFSGSVNTSRKLSFSGEVSHGDEILFTQNPYLGTTTSYKATLILRPFSRLQSAIYFDTNRFTDVRTANNVFDIKILRTETTYQFTSRLLVRNIMEHNTFDRNVGANVLVTYRVNSGTAFYIGYDDRYLRSDKLDMLVFPTTSYRRTNRAVFTKFQYLFRY